MNINTKAATRTLTNFYNARPTQLDEAVFAAYAWKSDLPSRTRFAKQIALAARTVNDAEVLEKLLGLNLEKSRSEAHI